MASDRTDRRRHRLSAETLRQLDELQVEISPNKSTVVTAELLNYIAKDGASHDVRPRAI